jgi:hypothetical protein
MPPAKSWRAIKGHDTMTTRYDTAQAVPHCLRHAVSQNQSELFDNVVSFCEIQRFSCDLRVFVCLNNAVCGIWL